MSAGPQGVRQCRNEGCGLGVSAPAPVALDWTCLLARCHCLPTPTGFAHGDRTKDMAGTVDDRSSNSPTGRRDPEPGDVDAKRRPTLGVNRNAPAEPISLHGGSRL